ncbi:hypothetical protein LOK49_LG05G01221 [Camellia lanceoleosa]|uniref:Uncharacterized protein n=1 Tax=Camellia lanceoleosa TaxID=1840588 RepID=A0ACC0HVI7_9ERIC|nr:hypothetical protein LOK49_LG05G01221 [Camellia lanceoleosa]
MEITSQKWAKDIVHLVIPIPALAKSRCTRLKSAGAVLVAKLVTGSLAYDDIWFGAEQGTRGILRNIPRFICWACCLHLSRYGSVHGGSETAGSITYLLLVVV